MEAIHNWVHENLELFRNLAKSQKFSMILSPCSKVQAGFLRLCAIPAGRVCAQHTPELACQVYMRVRVESAAEYWAQRSRGNGERRFAQHLAVGFPGRCVRSCTGDVAFQGVPYRAGDLTLVPASDRKLPGVVGGAAVPTPQQSPPAAKYSPEKANGDLLSI